MTASGWILILTGRSGRREVATLVLHAVDRPLLPFLGDPHVNVLGLNRALDRMAH